MIYFQFERSDEKQQGTIRSSYDQDRERKRKRERKKNGRPLSNPMVTTVRKTGTRNDGMMKRETHGTKKNESDSLSSRFYVSRRVSRD